MNWFSAHEKDLADVIFAEAKEALANSHLLWTSRTILFS